MIAGYYPGLAEAAREGVKDKVGPLKQALLSQEMFVAFSKKSPCRSLVDKFGQGILELTTNDSFNHMMDDATTSWNNAQKSSK